MYSTAPTSPFRGGTIVGEGSASQRTPSCVVPNPIAPRLGEAVQKPYRGYVHPTRTLHLYCIHPAAWGPCHAPPCSPMCWSAESLRRGDCVDAVPAAGTVRGGRRGAERAAGGGEGAGRWRRAAVGARRHACPKVAPGRVVVWSTPDGAGALPPPVLGPARTVEHVSLVGPVLPVRQDQERSGEVRRGQVRVRVRRSCLAVRRGSHAEALARRVLGHEVIDIVGPVLDKGPGVPLGAHRVRLEHQATGRAGREENSQHSASGSPAGGYMHAHPQNMCMCMHVHKAAQQPIGLRVKESQRDSPSELLGRLSIATGPDKVCRRH
eukprot:scaffold121934_cov66-Phaeocystis_antarctica.AAC.6